MDIKKRFPNLSFNYWGFITLTILIMKKIILLSSFCFLFIFQINAQRILAYFPYYRSTTDADNVDWAKLTDVVYAFANPTINTGVLDQPEYAQHTALFDYIADKAEANGVKVHISIGGGGLSYKLSQCIDVPSARTALISNIVNFVSGTNSGNHILAGVDVDWEFPQGTTEKNKHENFLKDLRTALDAREVQDSRQYELSIAVGGDVVSQPNNHSMYINAGAAQYCDFINLMVYDGPASYGNNHSTYQMAVDAINAYSSAPLNFPKSKFMLAVPFYGKDANGWNAELYSVIAASAPATAFGADSYNGWYYNGNQTLRDKVDLICNQGGMGITIWEITQDRNAGQQYTLLSAVKSQMSTSSCSTVSTQEVSKNGVSIYPNPTDGLVTVSGVGIQKITVYNVLGEQVFSESGSFQIKQLDFNNLSNGMYIVKIQNSNNEELSSMVLKN